MRCLYSIVFMILMFFFQACQEKVEGCMHPRAVNFNPEADINTNCEYFELFFTYNHYTSFSANDTLSFTDTLQDSENNPFIVKSIHFTGMALHLSDTLTGETKESIDRLEILLANGSKETVEDNFFIISPETYIFPVAGWVELGLYNHIDFKIGLDNNIQSSSPDYVSENNHPLSTDSEGISYNSDSMKYHSFYIQLFSVQDSIFHEIYSYDVFNFNFNGNINVIDNYDTPINLQINYDILFNNISVVNDNLSTLKSKIEQNILTAITHLP